MRTAAWLAVILALGACYGPSYAPCAVQCADEVCPGAMACGDDGYCHASLDEPRCDAPPDDGGGLDASPDALPPAAAFAVLAAGYDHTCGITAADGRLACWGSNDVAQLARARAGLRRSAVPLEVDDTAVGWDAVAAGDNHTCAIRDGALWCWGDNGVRQVGVGTGEVHETPQPLAGDDWVAVAAGAAHTCALRGAAGARSIECWGLDAEGELGDGTAGSSRATPNPIAAPEDGPVSDWATIAANATQTCATTASGRLYCWGYSSGGLGAGGTAVEATPVRVTHADVDAWTAVSTGRRAVCAVGDGALYCWGDNANGELGVAGPATSDVPVLTDDGGTWTAVAAGGLGACGVRDAVAWCWGIGASGQLGDGAYGFAATPRALDGLTGVTAIVAGGEHRCAIGTATTTGAHCWGRNHHGQLGDGTVSTAWSPVQIGDAGGWTDVSAGYYHTCGIRSGALACWGRNANLELGVAGPDRAVPTAVGDATDWTRVEAGYRHACGIRDDDATGGGDVRCWGNNDAGQLGSGGGTGDHLPGLLQGGGAMTEISAAHTGSCAIAAADGARWCWGYNEAGHPLVLDDQVDHPTPATIATTPAAWSAVSAGLGFGCGLGAGGTALACWGGDDDGEQGDGDDDGSPDPRPHVVDAGAWLDVSAARHGHHACAVRADGTLWCWGSNDSNQLARVGTDSLAPAEVARPATAAWQRVAAGTSQTCGIAGDKLYCWGSNEEGQLGIDGITFAVTPREVGEGQAWQDLTVGNAHACAITTGGDLWCWGISTRGQVGAGGAGRAAPTPVVMP
jgi:alpha-tubulin suppressor-like RCC1 family protein